MQNLISRTGTSNNRILSRDELRQDKLGWRLYSTLPRRPIAGVLDRVAGNYNIGAIFRLCDAFRVDTLIIAGTKVDFRNRRLVQASRGTRRWVPWMYVEEAATFVQEAKAAGAWVVIAEQTTTSLAPDQIVPKFPACLVLGAETGGVSQSGDRFGRHHGGH